MHFLPFLSVMKRFSTNSTDVMFFLVLQPERSFFTFYSNNTIRAIFFCFICFIYFLFFVNSGEKHFVFVWMLMMLLWNPNFPLWENISDFISNSVFPSFCFGFLLSFLHSVLPSFFPPSFSTFILSFLPIFLPFFLPYFLPFPPSFSSFLSEVYLYIACTFILWILQKSLMYF